MITGSWGQVTTRELGAGVRSSLADPATSMVLLVSQNTIRFLNMIVTGG